MSDYSLTLNSTQIQEISAQLTTDPHRWDEERKLDDRLFRLKDGLEVSLTRFKDGTLEVTAWVEDSLESWLGSDDAPQLVRKVGHDRVGIPINVTSYFQH